MKRGDFSALAVIGVLCLAAWYSGVWSNRPAEMSSHARDLYSAYLPNLDYAAGELRAGRMAWWNPYEFAGMPFAATLEFGPFYPLTLVYALGDVADMHLLSGLVHGLMFASFMFAFLRVAIGLGTVASAFGAVTALLSGWSLSRGLIYPDAFRSGVYIPLVLLAVERCVSRRTLRWSGILGLAMGLQFLAGELEIFVRTGILAGVYTLYLVAIRRSSPSGGLGEFAGRLVYPALGVLIAVLLIGVQLVPTWHVAGASLRSTGGLSYAEAVNPVDGGVERPLELLGGLAIDLGPPLVYYVGPLALMFGLIALHARRADGYFFGGCGLLLFLLILGDGTPLYRLYFALPTGDWFRFPLRLQPFFLTCVVVASSIGVEHWLRFAGDTKAVRRRAQKLAVGVLGATLFVVAVLLLSVEYRLSLSLAAVIGAAMVPAGLVLHGPPLRVAAVAFLVAITLITGLMERDISAYIAPRHPDLAGFSDEVRLALNRERQVGERVYIDAAVASGRRVPKYGLLTRTPCIDGFSPFVSQSFWDFVKPHRSDRLLASAAALEAEGRDSSLGLWGGLAMKNGAGEALDMLGVRYVVVGPGSELFENEEERGGFRVVYAEEEIEILENTSAWPRAFVVAAGASYETSEELDAARRVAADVLVYEPGRVVVALPPGEGGTLILTDQHAEGWSAAVDGEGGAVERAAGLFRAVRVDAGAATVEFTYLPPGLVLGLFMTAIGVLFAAICLLVPKRLYSTS